jgi:hypothetical protein
MEPQQNTRVLIVANRTASTPELLETVRRRAEASPCEFALLIPDVTNRNAADWTLETALRHLRPATRARVEGLVGGSDPFESVQAAVGQGNVDEIIISTLPRRVSKWLRRDLIRRVEGLGLPVTVITPDEAPAHDASSGKSIDANARDALGAWGIMVSRKHRPRD